MKTNITLQFRQLNVHWTQHAKKKQQYGTDSDIMTVLWRVSQYRWIYWSLLNFCSLKVLQLHRRLKGCLQCWERLPTTVRDRKTVRLMKSLWRPSGRLYTARSFAGLKNTCYVNFALFQQRTFRIRNSLQIVCLWIAVPSSWYQFNF